MFKFTHTNTRIILVLLLQVFIQNHAWGQQNNAINSTLKDTIGLNEVMVTRVPSTKMTGLLSGKITLHVEGVKTLPAIMGNIDLLKMLELTPGVQTSGDGNSNLYVRGGDPGQNLLLYNDNVIYTPGHILSFFPLFNVDHLSSIELMKSGVNARYGGFISSAIVVKSTNQLPLKTGVKGSIGLLSSQSTLSVRLGNKFGAYLSGRASYLGLILQPLLNATINKDAENDINKMKYDFHDLNFTLIGELSAKNKLVVNAFSGKDKLNIIDDDIAIDGVLHWQNTAISAKLETQLSDETKLEQQLNYSRYQNNLRTEQAEMLISVFSQVEEIGYKNNLSYSIAGIPLNSGIQYIRHRLLPQDTRVRNAGVDYNKQTLGRITANDASLFTATNLRLFSNLYLEPGIRYNLYTAKTESTGRTKVFQSVDFRIAGRYQLNETRFLRASYSHNNQYMNKLTPSSLGLPTDFWVTASSDILPQRGDEASVGYYQLLFDGGFELSSDLYYRKMKNVTEFNMNFIENENIPFSDKIMYGKGTAYGLEVMLKKNAGKFTGWLSYALGRSERRFDEINDGKPFPARYDRTHDLSLVGSYTFNNTWDASLVYVYATGNAYTQPSSWYFMNNTPVKDYDKYNNARIPNYNRTDISINYWFKKDNGLNFSIYNMFMVNNPTYIFLLINREKKSEQVELTVKRKKLFTIVPSISWRYKF